jgi:hypothetical protein
VDTGRVDPASARRHLEMIGASPRPAGGDAETRARAYCADVLRGAGFAVAEEVFSYSELPGRVATPAFGALSAILFAAVGHLGWRGEAGLALVLVIAGAAGAAIAARWLMRSGVLSLPWMRARSTNLVGIRGNPSLWLVAHLDSKSQPVPIVVRALAVMAVLLAMGAALALAAVQLAGYDVRAAWPWVTGAGALASLPVMASLTRARSAGAIDDASGVSTVLLVAQSLPQQLAAGVVLTSAEELGLAGARAWVKGRGVAHAVNVDGVDDEGDVRLTWTSRRPSALIAQLVARADERGVRVRVGRLAPGALLDAVAFADAGWDAVTVSRGTLRTVARVHTPRDSLEHVRGEGVAVAASIITAAITVGA